MAARSRGVWRTELAKIRHEEMYKGLNKYIDIINSHPSYRVLRERGTNIWLRTNESGNVYSY